MEDETVKEQEQSEAEAGVDSNPENEAARPSHKTREQLEASLEHIARSPSQSGIVELIVCRPADNQRTELEQAELTKEDGLRGDIWKARQASRGLTTSDNQLTLMNSRVIAAIASSRADWPLAGDQLFVDFDLSAANLPPGTRLRVGSAVVEVTAEPHLGCRKFSDRFGKAATAFVNSDVGKSLKLRGVNARVVVEGLVSRGDSIAKY